MAVTVAPATLLLLFLQLQWISSSAIVFKAEVCGDEKISFSGSFDSGLLYIDGILVDKSLFCDAIKFHYAKGCFLEDYHRFCYLSSSQVDLHPFGGRKLLLEGTKEDSTVNPKSNRTFLTHKTIGMAVPGILALCCVLVCPCFYRKRKEVDHAVLEKEPSSLNSVTIRDVNSPEKIPGSPLRVPPSPRFAMSPKLSRFGSVHLNLNQLVKATHNFSNAMRIGEGGFGTVYKAQLENGQMVAVKRSRKELFDSLRTEFSSEVELLAKIDHRSLVRLLGFVDKGNERLIVTEYVPNGTLRAHLDGKISITISFSGLDN